MSVELSIIQYTVIVPERLFSFQLNIALFNEVNKRYQKFHVNVTIDFCQAFQKSSTASLTPVIQAIFDDVFAHTDLPKHCPILKV